MAMPIPIDPQWLCTTLTTYLRYAFGHVLHPNANITPYIQRALDLCNPRSPLPCLNNDFLFEHVLQTVDRRQQGLPVEDDAITRNLEVLAHYLIGRAQVKGPYELPRGGGENVGRSKSANFLSQLATSLAGIYLRERSFRDSHPPHCSYSTAVSQHSLTEAPAWLSGLPRQREIQPIDPRLLGAQPGQFVSSELRGTLSASEEQYYRQEHHRRKSSGNQPIDPRLVYAQPGQFTSPELPQILSPVEDAYYRNENRRRKAAAPWAPHLVQMSNDEFPTAPMGFHTTLSFRPSPGATPSPQLASHPGPQLASHPGPQLASHPGPQLASYPGPQSFPRSGPGFRPGCGVLIPQSLGNSVAPCNDHAWTEHPHIGQQPAPPRPHLGPRSDPGVRQGFSVLTPRPVGNSVAPCNEHAWTEHPHIGQEPAPPGPSALRVREPPSPPWHAYTPVVPSQQAPQAPTPPPQPNHPIQFDNPSDPYRGECTIEEIPTWSTPDELEANMAVFRKLSHQEKLDKLTRILTALQKTHPWEFSPAEREPPRKHEVPGPHPSARRSLRQAVRRRQGATVATAAPAQMPLPQLQQENLEVSKTDLSAGEAAYHPGYTNVAEHVPDEHIEVEKESSSEG